MQTVISKDGTKIVYEKTGSGPAVILVAGAMSTMSSFEELADLLSPYFTVYCYDRRGRGDSTDTMPYSVEKETEDIEALIDEIGSSVSLYGISSGACLALEAASKLGTKIKKLAMYEAPYDESEEAKEKWHAYTKKLKELITTGNHSDAIALFMQFVGVPEDMIKGMKASPVWKEMEKTSPTLIYDAACMGEDRFIPAEKAKQITAQTFVIDGSESMEIMPFMHESAVKLVAAIPQAQEHILEGQQHNVDAKALAPVLKNFFQ